MWKAASSGRQMVVEIVAWIHQAQVMPLAAVVLTSYNGNLEWTVDYCVDGCAVAVERMLKNAGITD